MSNCVNAILGCPNVMVRNGYCTPIFFLLTSGIVFRKFLGFKKVGLVELWGGGGCTRGVCSPQPTRNDHYYRIRWIHCAVWVGASSELQTLGINTAIPSYLIFRIVVWKWCVRSCFLRKNGRQRRPSVWDTHKCMHVNYWQSSIYGKSAPPLPPTVRKKVENQTNY